MKLQQQDPSQDSHSPNLQSSTMRFPIYANVYQFSPCCNACCSCFGLGLYHTGIELFNHEYMFATMAQQGTGVICCYPKSAAYTFQEQILLGYTEYTYYEVDLHVLQPLRYQFRGNRYDLLNFNCNHFAYRFAEMLQMKEKFPQKVLAATDLLDYLRCCLPSCILSGRLDWFRSEPDKEGEQELMEI